jgi:hypothetical protein
MMQSLLGPVCRPIRATISDSNVAHWVETVYCNVAGRQEVKASPDICKFFVPDFEAEFLTQIGKDLDDLPASIRSSPGAEHCRRFTEGVGLALASIPRVRCAAFGDEKDSVTLLAHSRASMRQVSFEFKRDENSISIISIDEEMHRFERACSIDKTRTLAEAIAWLNPR